MKRTVASPTRLAVAAGVIVPLTAFVAVLFLSGGTASGSPDSVALVKPGVIGTTPSEPPPTLTVRDSYYGRILFDGRGRALYAFTRDERSRGACKGACAEAWPPYLIRGSVRAGAGVKASLLDTVRRADGARQVTYAGRPLYYWIGDKERGDVGCQNVLEFGGLWLVTRPDGELVTS
jgi:predicted lipoprotein with Yx(FWY)xxD motif